jgi:hypothetical protein
LQYLAHSPAVKASMAPVTAAQSASRIRAATFLLSALSLAKEF